jgi:hypothetical protein
VLDLEARTFRSAGIGEVVAASPDLPIERFATRRRSSEGWVLTFGDLLWATSLVDDVSDLLRILKDAYRTHVDVEFTANFLATGELRLNLVQCRPLQISEGGAVPPPPQDVPEEAVVLASRGPVVGQSRNTRIDRVVWVDPDAYAALGTQDRHETARVIGRVTRHAGSEHLAVLLAGPGRWGTTTVSLGVPVSFAEIQRATAICEVMRLGHVVPDVSLGSHFFNDLVEENLLYLAVYPGYDGHRVDEARLRSAPNRLEELCPDDARMAPVVRVVDFPLPGDDRTLWLHASCVAQTAVCHLARQGAAGEGR